MLFFVPSSAKINFLKVHTQVLPLLYTATVFIAWSYRQISCGVICFDEPLIFGGKADGERA